MSDSRVASTLELVENEQRMSHIDLSPGSQQQGQTQPENASRSYLTLLMEWPRRFYSALCARLEDAKLKSDSQCDYILKVVHEISSILVWLLCFISTVIIPVVFFFLGLFSIDKCEDRVALPYLVLGIGFVMCMSNLFNLALSLNIPVLSNHEFLTPDLKNIIASIVNVILNCLAAFLYTICAYFVFTLSAKSGETEGPPNCSSLLYNFTFWFIFITLSMSISLCVIGTCLFIYNRYRLALVRGSTPSS